MVKSTDWFKTGPSICKWFSYRLQICTFSGLVIGWWSKLRTAHPYPTQNWVPPRGSILVVNYVHHTIGPIFHVQYHYRYVYHKVFFFFNLIFFSKSSQFRVVRTIRFVQISLAYGTNTFTHSDADISILKSLLTLFDKFLDHMLGKFEQNRMIQIMQNFVLFDKKWLTFFDKVLTPFRKTFL